MNNKSIIWRDFTRKCKDTRGRFRGPLIFTTIIKFVHMPRDVVAPNRARHINTGGF